MVHWYKNKYALQSRISEKKFREIIHLFSEGLSATQISHLIGLSKKQLTNVWQLSNY